MTSLVDNPVAATTRVRNNRNVNLKKKQRAEEGKQALASLKRKSPVDEDLAPPAAQRPCRVVPSLAHAHAGLPGNRFDGSTFGDDGTQGADAAPGFPTFYYS